MASQPGNKGFMKELAAPAPASEPKAKLDWSKQIVPSKAKPHNTPRRIQEQKAVAAPKSNLVAEHTKHKNTTRGKK